MKSKRNAKRMSDFLNKLVQGKINWFMNQGVNGWYNKKIIFQMFIKVHEWIREWIDKSIKFLESGHYY